MTHESLFPDDEFLSADPCLNGLVLDPDGLRTSVEHTTLQVCHPCNRYLPRLLMPRYALANKLYRGRLPKEFQDFTWIKEWVCAKYSNAVVTRLYQSSGPSQPVVFHGNTCAHEMNVSSTPAMLPRAPPDVNGLLGVVFGVFKTQTRVPRKHVQDSQIKGLWLLTMAKCSQQTLKRCFVGQANDGPIADSRIVKDVSVISSRPLRSLTSISQGIMFLYPVKLLAALTLSCSNRCKSLKGRGLLEHWSRKVRPWL